MIKTVASIDIIVSRMALVVLTSVFKMLNGSIKTGGITLYDGMHRDADGLVKR